MSVLTPREIVSELDKYIIGQKQAKKMVAIALRNRWRRRRLDDELREEVVPKNIIMMGPTGVGKTEIARRLARLAGAPFYKVEATKFTEVGYVGRDVESMVRDLMEIGINLVRAEEQERVKNKAEVEAEERLLDVLLPSSPRRPVPDSGHEVLEAAQGEDSTRSKLRAMLRKGKLDGREVEIEVTEAGPRVEVMSMPGIEVNKKHRPDPKGVCVFKMSVLMPMLPDIYFPSFRECQDSAAEYRDPRRLFQNPCMPHQS